MAYERDDAYYNERLRQLENSYKNNSSTTTNKTQRELELEQENEVLKQRLQMSADPIRTKFMQSAEYREAWLCNIAEYVHERFMADWAKTNYAKNLDAWVEKRVKELKEADVKSQPQSQQPQHFRQQPNYPQPINNQ